MHLRARSTRHARLAIVAMAAIACGLLTLPVSGLLPARAATGPTITASPSSNLADGQFVKLDLSGFPPSVGVVFRECKASPVNVATDCTAIDTQVLAVLDATGATETYLPVYEGNDLALENAGGTGSVTCDAHHACVIAGVRDTTDLASAVFAPISFGLSPDLCPPPSAYSGVLGSGSATAYRAMYQWESAVCGPPSHLSVGYALSNSVDGVNNFGTRLTDFGVTGPLPPFSLPSGAPSFKYAPITTSALVLAYRIYDLRGQQITHLTLTPWLIGQIYQGLIPNWAQNPDITFLNPGVEFPGIVVPYARAEHSAESYVFTSWLSATLGRSGWPAGPQSIFPEPATGVTGVTTSSHLGFAVANPTTPWSTTGNIGFMDASTAAFYGLPTVTIRRSNLSLISATPATIAQAVADSTTNADGTLTPNYATLDPNAYPMPITSYMLAPTSGITPAKGVTLAAFLRYAVQAGQSNLPAGYAPLSSGLVAESLRVAGEIPVKAPPPPRPTPTPTPTRTPTYTYTPPANQGGGSSSIPTPVVPTPSPTATCARSSASGATPTASAGATTTSSRSPTATSSCAGAGAGSTPTGPTLTAAPPWLLSEAGSNYVLPAIVLVALIGLAAGPAAEWISRRRRPLSSATAGPGGAGSAGTDSVG